MIKLTDGQKATLKIMVDNGDNFIVIGDNLKITGYQAMGAAIGFGYYKIKKRRWSAKDDDFIMQNYKNGIPASEIAAYFGVTRNAVIGRAGRLGLFGNPSATQKAVAHRVSEIAKLKPDIAKCDGKTLYEHEPGQCLYGFGRKKGTHIFCCESVFEKTAYCEKHYDLCHQSRAL